MADPRKIYFSGVGGSGVSALALFARMQGQDVVGSDRAFDQDPGHPLKKRLEAAGIRLVPQDGSALTREFGLVVMSTAVEPDRPEVLRARKLGIPLRTRPEYLAELCSAFESTALSGTSGKSTAAGLLAWLMERLGLGPNFLGGGRVKQFASEVNPGNALSGSSRRLVLEACESDGTIVTYRPRDTVLLNLALDHHRVEDTQEMFRALAGNTSGAVIANADDPNLAPVIPPGALTFSLRETSAFRAADLVLGPLSSEFTVGGTKVRLSLPGKHNVLNALAALAALSAMGVPVREAIPHLAEFEGIERRFDLHLDEGGRLVIDDYAHNPHKIAALMASVRALRASACYVFQPHGYGPTRLMREEYIQAFASGLRDADRLLLLPIFYAGGTAARDISSEDLAAGVRNRGRRAETVPDRAALLEALGEEEAVVVMGARDESLSHLAHMIAQKLTGAAA
ncbi:MAG: Mur ligase domain-containing protein [Nitrospirota bacterium]|jgi:UDP-N-acetylmuramate--alanine ligase